METKNYVIFGLILALIIALVVGFSMLNTIKDNKANAIKLENTIKEKSAIIIAKENIIAELDKKPADVKIVNVPVEKIVEVEKLVDNKNLSVVLDHIYDNEGNVDYLVDDLDDDELSLIVERISFINAIKIIGVDKVKSDLFDELDGESIGEYEFDEDELEKLKIDDEADEIEVIDIDFDDNDAELKITFSFEDEDDVEFEGYAIVSFDDGEFDEIEDIVIY